jgi:hypothetical protein
MFVNPIQPVKTRFSPAVDKEIETYVWERLDSIIKSTKDLKETKVKKWRRLLKGIPAEEKKSFPWENASNVVIQIIATCRDILQAAVMGSIWGVLPIYTASLIGEWDETEHGEDQRKALEEAMSFWSSEPTELDLMRVENLWFGEAIGFGTSFTKTPYEYLTETQVVGVTGEGSSVGLNEREFVKKSGPSPEKIPFEDFGVDPSASTLSSADFKYHVKHLKKWDLEERAAKGIYTREQVNKIKSQPDRSGKDTVKQQAQQDQGIQTSSNNVDAEWDIYECWLSYFHNDKKYRLIYSYHFRSRTVLKSIFNFYPENDDPFRMARLGWDDDGIYGLGFAEMLEHYQEEISTGHNQRCDNRTLGNTSVLRVSRISRIDSNFSVYPLATIPGEKDEIEVMNLGAPMPPDIQGESLTISLAERRAGVEIGVSGAGGGQTNPKKGIYSAQGTFAVMQAGNKRNNLRTTDMRYAHIELGRLILKLNAHFGIGDKARIFGNKEPFLRSALQNVKAGRLTFPIRAATESVNKELEKQNLMLLVNVVKQHHMGVAQLLQSITGPQAQMMPDEIKKYLVDMIKAADYLMQDLLAAFNMNDIARLLPLPDFIKKSESGDMNNGNTRTSNSNSTSSGDGEQSVQNSSGESFSTVPSSTSGMGEVSNVSNGTS